MSQDFSSMPPGGPNSGQGGAQYSSPHGPAPDNYLIFAVLSTLFCCFVPGIVSIVYAAQVNGKHYAGDIQGAKAASSSARSWAIVSAATAIIFVLGVILYSGTAVFSLIGLTESNTP